MSDFSQIQFEERLVAEIVHIELCGVGRHRARSLRSLKGQAREILKRNGFDEQTTDAVIKNVQDMAALELLAE